MSGAILEEMEQESVCSHPLMGQVRGKPGDSAMTLKPGDKELGQGGRKRVVIWTLVPTTASTAVNQSAQVNNIIIQKRT